MTVQPRLDLEPGRCQYGEGNADDSPFGPQCPEPRTHRACYRHDGKTGSIECCRRHADYFATAWVPFCLTMGFDVDPDDDDAAWIEYIGLPPWHVVQLMHNLEDALAEAKRHRATTG